MKKVFKYAVIVGVVYLLFTYRVNLADDTFGYRGPIEVTIETSDGSKSEFPFIVETGNAESCGHGGCGFKNSYEFTRKVYAYTPYEFPRKRIDLVQANDYASIGFVTLHPHYHLEYFRTGFGPSPGDEALKISIKVMPFTELMQKLELHAEQVKLAMAAHPPDSDEYKKLSIRYWRARYNLGSAIRQHISRIKLRYLPLFPYEERKKIIAKYRPIFKKWFYSVPETTCWDSVDCDRQIQKPRTLEYDGP